MVNDSINCYIDELIDPFYESASNDINYLSIGQICWAPVSYIQSQIDVWRPVYIEDESPDYATLIIST